MSHSSIYVSAAFEYVKLAAERHALRALQSTIEVSYDKISAERQSISDCTASSTGYYSIMSGA